MTNFLKANISDAIRIQKLAQASWRENYPGIISQEQIEYMLNKMYSIDQLQCQLAKKNYHYYFINDHQDAIGFILIIEEKENLKLDRIYLLKKEKGKKHGKKALDFIKEFGKRHHYSTILLNVNKENPAILFYKSQGFKIIEEGVFNIGNGFVMDDYIMEYKL